MRPRAFACPIRRDDERPDLRYEVISFIPCSGKPIPNGVVIVTSGKIEKVGPAGQTPIPANYRTLQAKVVTPGLIDAHTVVGFSGYLNQEHDQEQVERSAPAQPELRPLDAYDSRERLVEYVRSFGITTMHTGHGPGTLVSGQTMIVKTAGDTGEQAVVQPSRDGCRDSWQRSASSDSASPRHAGEDDRHAPVGLG